MHNEETADEEIGRSISLIDHGIKSLANLTFPVELLRINLHCNEIKRIENLGNLVNLRFLDLSSNEIKVIERLESLVNLQVLNLACNQIQMVTGLGPLRKLEKLNLSYNVINDLTGLKEFRRNTHALKCIEIHGNKINSLKQLVECIALCGTLESLILTRNSDSNPVCSVPAFRPTIFAQLPKLKILDGKDKHGNFLAAENLEFLHPGLDNYLQWLMESNQSDSCSPSEKSEAHSDLKTPKIDEALHKFKSRVEARTEREEQGKIPISAEDLNRTENLKDRLGSLEKQIETLLYLQMRNQMIPEKDTVSTTVDSPASHVDSSKTTSKLPRRKIDKKVGGRERLLAGPMRGRKLSAIPKGRPERRASSPDELQQAGKKIRDAKDDEAALMLMKELDEERERRWKAEQATRKLVNTVKEMQEKIEDERRISESAIAASVKVKTAFSAEKEGRLRLEKSLDEQMGKFNELSEDVKNLRQYELDAKKIIGNLEETSRNAEKERLKVQALKDKQLQEAQFKAAALRRENELLQENEKNLKMRINQLQELLANREQDHKSTLDGMVKMGGNEVRELVEKEMAKQEGRYAQLIQNYTEKIESRNRDYAMLEDEFRAGLQMEANRFAELQDAFAQLTHEHSELKKSFQALKQKESKATSLVTELTSMVKEQKGRLEEISKSKQEMQTGFKERILALDAQLESNRKQSSKMEQFKQERDKLLSQVKAHESVIEGLRTERKLWGKELAQQGASLAHDRGRLEAQIESLMSEVRLLKQKEKENVDGLKIKTKLIEDQTDSIKKLKQEVEEAKTDLKTLNDRARFERKSLEKDLDKERHDCQQLQEAYEKLGDRKDELKSQLGIAENDLEVKRDEIRNLKKKWEERSHLIGQLEEKVLKMKENFDSKEQTSKEEKDRALKSESETREKLKHCDDSFRRQLDEKQRVHDLEVRRIIAEKDDDLSKAKLKILEVEEEMRVLLEETSSSKRIFEQKIHQLSKAFAEVQQGLVS